MKLKKVLAFGLCAIMLIGMVGCGQKDKATPLPFGLKFGDTYERIQENLDIGELHDATANDGYGTDVIPITDEETIEILGTSDGVKGVAVSLWFNAEKEFYEFYCIFKTGGDQRLEVSDAIVQKYTALLGEGKEDTDVIAEWETDEYVVSYVCDDPFTALAGKETTHYICMHSKEFDFVE